MAKAPPSESSMPFDSSPRDDGGDEWLPCPTCGAPLDAEVAETGYQGIHHVIKAVRVFCTACSFEHRVEVKTIIIIESDRGEA